MYIDKFDLTTVHTLKSNIAYFMQDVCATLATVVGVLVKIPVMLEVGPPC